MNVKYIDFNCTDVGMSGFVPTEELLLSYCASVYPRILSLC